VTIHEEALSGSLPPDVAEAARELVDGLVSQPWGQVSPSIYETGRLVTLAPWLAGHVRRVEYLLSEQRADGGWGGPGGYALAPTLSAIEAILVTLRRRDGRPEDALEPGPAPADLATAAGRGLGVLSSWLRGPAAVAVPDMPAVELIVPGLIDAVNEHLAALHDDGFSDLGPWCGGEPLRPPRGMDGAALTVIRSRLRSGAAVPEKLLHALEVAGDAAAGADTVRPERTGTVGASPAATAAWLAGRTPPAPGDPARRYLETVAERHGGPVPCGLPVTVFERAWVLAWLLRAGIEPAVPAELVESLTALMGSAGTPAAAGLPPDADTTAGALYALSLAGAPLPPDPLWAYETKTHFCTWQGENGLSVSTNAHVLEAFGRFLEIGAAHAGSRPRYAATAGKVAAWLRAQQEADGSWLDRWHASPYYATACCAPALDRFDGERSATAVRRAARWVVATQRPDGSWGRWHGTAEETAYAMQTLLLTRAGDDGGCREAVRRGRAYLLRSAGRAEDPPLWHDKDLYLPKAIVRAAVLAALHLARPSR
jgi:halimadienyl-diphosphate synthase